MIMLDTNVLSALMEPEPDRKVVAWINAQLPSSIWTTAINVYEVLFGLYAMPAGRRQIAYLKAFEGLLDDIGRRVANLNGAAADRSAELAAARKRRGTPIEFRDTMIAGIALAHNASIATGNIRHFSDLSVPVINPWK